MTTSREEELERRRLAAPRRARNLAESLARAMIRRAVELGAETTEASVWPSPRYRESPVGFFREILGVEPWSRQVEVIEAIRDNPRVAVRGGHKISKSHTFAGIALWFYSSYDQARVVMSSTTSRQVDAILWRELRMMHAFSGRCVACKQLDEEKVERRERTGPRPCPHSALITGDLHDKARTGLISDDFREIQGFTAREAEAVAGVSGKNLLYLLDEASGIPEPIFEAIEGNRAGGARIAMFSNPTRTEGEFFEAFEGSKKKFYKTLTISSEEVPNVVLGREVIRGHATREWIEEKKQEWGEDSPLYTIRVKGRHALKEEGKILSVHAIIEAERRWAEHVDENGVPLLVPGRLFLGLDPAGPGGAGDESAWALRREWKISKLHCRRGLNEDAHLVETLGLIEVDRRLNDLKPLVILDRDGPIGAKIFNRFRAYIEELESRGGAPAFELYGVRSSERAKLRPNEYDLVRDEMYMSFHLWVKDGGAFPEDSRLAKDLHAPKWELDVRNRAKATPKKELRAILGRSPDRGDACILSTWVPPNLDEPPGAKPATAASLVDRDEFGDAPVLDPYAASPFNRR